jgi:16S rRNA (uracil1498-N3)-methyltransferase
MLTLFLIENLSAATNIEVSGDEAHHAIKVLRVKVGEEILLCDGNGSWARAAISQIDKKSFQAGVLERGYEEERSPKLIVIQGLPKSDRVKESIEILVESGVDVIIPWQAERSISKWQQGSLEKWQNVLTASTKQSRRYRAPEIRGEQTIAQILAEVSTSKVVIVLHESATKKISQVINSKFAELGEIFVVIGPEGGLSENELKAFEAAGAHIACLGSEIFRSAHAGGAALSAISALIGRW